MIKLSLQQYYQCPNFPKSNEILIRDRSLIIVRGGLEVSGVGLVFYSGQKGWVLLFS